MVFASRVECHPAPGWRYGENSVLRPGVSGRAFAAGTQRVPSWQATTAPARTGRSPAGDAEGDRNGPRRWEKSNADNVDELRGGRPWTPCGTAAARPGRGHAADTRGRGEPCVRRGRRPGGVQGPRHPRYRRQERGGHPGPVSYTHLRAHETVLDLVCRLL